ncbi:hypothetical protein BT96DRAFT_1008991 [Gymnopus androsaceus JB14]|uniref:Uncharacterized protein n=1 Tax=Gymnopus androsaceus JB14 TaxID=1447944 RepID=A0A6A4GDQ8_9AGAR|nr:hypothetical protein BT96DRAFT_1008991 [Gymnopus androsaceus JB14]
MITSRPIPHLAEQTPPPPPMFMLLAHSDIPQPRLAPLLVHSDLRAHRQAPSTRPHPYRRSSDMRSMSPLSSIMDSTDDDTPNSGVTIRKGTIARPRSAGRFSLDELKRSLGWSTNDFDEIRNYLKDLSDQHLKPASYQNQSESALKTVRDLIVTKYPRLNDYAKAWPVKCMLIGILKRASEAAKQAGPSDLTSAARRRRR